MVYWECPSLRASEVDPLGEVDQDAMTNHIYLRTNIKKDFVADSMSCGSVHGQVAAPWSERLYPFHLIVKAYYFPMDLTYASDRLPAMSGVARWFMKQLGLRPDDYMAGLWRESLPECLLWHYFRKPKTSASRSLEAAPSWSWASIVSDEVLVLGNRNMVDPRPLIQNLQPTIIPKDGHFFGQLHVATLRLDCSLIPFDRVWKKGEPFIRLPGSSKTYKESHDPWSAGADSLREKLREHVQDAICRIRKLESPQERRSKQLQDRHTGTYVQVRWDTTDLLRSDESSLRHGRFHMVPILWDWGIGSPENTDPRRLGIRGLILERLPSKGQYERVGMFMTACYDNYQNLELTGLILQHIPTRALDLPPGGALRQDPGAGGWTSHLMTRLLQNKPKDWRERDMTATAPTTGRTGSTIGPGDHLGVNAIGLYTIEIL